MMIVGGPRSQVAIFYICLGASGSSVATAREQRWFYAVIDEPPFWQHLTELYAALLDGRVAWDVLPQCWSTWISMVLITTLDSLLMLTTTETVRGHLDASPLRASSIAPMMVADDHRSPL